MVKIEIQIIDSGNGACKVNIGKTKHLKTSTDNEKMVANSVHYTIEQSIKAISNN